MAKRKSDFHELNFINPFDDKHFKQMVYKDWTNPTIFSQWRKDNSTWLKDPKMINFLDVDELLTQWDIHPEKRKVNPSTCNMIFKELAIVLRMVDAEHQDVIFSKDITLPGIVYSDSSKKWIFLSYTIDETNAKKSTRVLRYDSEEEAYYYYKENRDNLIETTSTKAIEYGLIEESLYNKYFIDSNNISVRSYNFYKGGAI